MSRLVRVGGGAAVAGLVAFLAIHHVWIRPIWFVAPLGTVIAIPGGVAVAWAYGELLPGLPRHRRCAVVAGTALALAPSIALAELRPPFFDPASGELAPGVGLERVLAAFGAELLLPSALTAAALGALVGRTRRAAIACGVAGLALALGPGHNIPLVGGTPGAVKGTLLLAAAVVVAALVLVALHARAHPGSAPKDHGGPGTRAAPRGATIARR